jgi:acyl-CoA thioester hydrolase
MRLQFQPPACRAVQQRGIDGNSALFVERIAQDAGMHTVYEGFAAWRLFYTILYLLCNISLRGGYVVKPAALPLDVITALTRLYRLTVPVEFLDENGHMNMRYYLHIFDEAGYPLVAQFGLTPDYHQQHQTGGFDLEHHLHYLREVRAGDVVVVYARLVGRSAKRIHYLMFLVNETQGVLSAIFECVNSFADMATRRTAAYPPEIAAKIDAIVAEHQALAWAAPICGVMSA